MYVQEGYIESMNLFNGCSKSTLTNGLFWLNEPQEWFFDNNGVLNVLPRPKSDYFRPYQRVCADNAAILCREVEGDFTIKVFVSADLTDFADAGGLLVLSGSSLWAKLCMERNHEGQISTVSVVTNPYSDDANGELLTGNECHLRITRKGDYFGMHYSLDGQAWRLVRCFGLEFPKTVNVGILTQAPVGLGCNIRLNSLDLQFTTIDDFRSGK